MSEVRMLQQKKKFNNIVNKVEQQYRNSNIIYRQKYYQLSEELNQLYRQVTRCRQIILNNAGKDKQNDGDQNRDQSQAIKKQVDPKAMIEYMKSFCGFIITKYDSYKSKQQKIKQEITNLYALQNNQNCLEVLAKRSLENYDLNLKTEQLQSNLELKILQCNLIQKTAYEYQKKFQQYQKDYTQVVKAIANILKQCQLTQLQLRQKNRFQRQLMQAHKIQFLRYKTNFKLKPSFDSKVNRIKQVLDKKYQERQEILVKQTQKIVEKRLKQQIACACNCHSTIKHKTT